LFMTILALEFSSPQRSVAVLRTGDTQVAAEAVETGGRNTAAFGMVEKVFAETKTGREQIDVIVVGLGPGSYTGIRAAISIAQGWQLAREIKLIGISSVEAIVAQAQAEKVFGRANVVVDAQRNEFYLAAYEILSGGWQEIGPLKIFPLSEVQPRADAKEFLIGPEVTKWFPNGRTIFPRAAMLAKLAANQNDFVAGEKLEPVYLRETNFVKTPARQKGAGV
jgi:tRNA threonylcarbamoyladenosine biosynthesis protein TsaB